MSSCLEGGSLRATVGAVKPRTDAAPAADNENNTHTPRAPDQQHTQSLALLLCFPPLRYPPPPEVNANRQQLNCWQEASQAAWQLPHSITSRMTMMRWLWGGGWAGGGVRCFRLAACSINKLPSGWELGTVSSHAAPRLDTMLAPFCCLPFLL